MIRPVSHHTSPSSNAEILGAKPPKNALPKHPPSKQPSPPPASDDDNDIPSRPQARITNHQPPPPHSSDDLPLLGPLNPSANQWAMVYYPYTSTSSCKSASTIRSDIAAIASAGFTTIRLHACDCNALTAVGAAALLHGLRMIVGIHIDEAGIDDMAIEQVDELIAWATTSSFSTSSSNHTQIKGSGWDLIELLTIGEETIFNYPDEEGVSAYATVLAHFIITTRHRLRHAGYHGPITTIEPIPTLYTHRRTLCPAIDIPAANIHPFFVDDVSAASAGAFVAHALSILEDICDGIGGPRGLDVVGWPGIGAMGRREIVKAINLETGWPHHGLSNGRAKPGRAEQMVALHGIMRMVGRRSVVLGWGDDAWKDPGEWEVEGGWGCEGFFAGKGARG